MKAKRVTHLFWQSEEDWMQMTKQYDKTREGTIKGYLCENTICILPYYLSLISSFIFLFGFHFFLLPGSSLPFFRLPTSFFLFLFPFTFYIWSPFRFFPLLLSLSFVIFTENGKTINKYQHIHIQTLTHTHGYTTNKWLWTTNIPQKKKKETECTDANTHIWTRYMKKKTQAHSHEYTLAYEHTHTWKGMFVTP